MPQFELLGGLVTNLHQEFVKIYYLLLPVFFSIAVVLAWFKSPVGSPEFLDILKRAIVSTILLVSFPDISEAIVFVADGIAEKIDQAQNLDVFLKMAGEKANSYPNSSFSVVLAVNDLIIAFLSFASYLLLYVARYLTVAMYHFFWLFLIVSSPILLLFNLFSGTQHITRNLFKGMIEVASWKIVWAILGAMISSLSFGNAFAVEGNYLVLIVMNFVIAATMLMTPKLVRSISEGGSHSISSGVGTLATTVMVAAYPKSRHGLNLAKSVYSDHKEFFKRNVLPRRTK